MTHTDRRGHTLAHQHPLSRVHTLEHILEYTLEHALEHILVGAAIKGEAGKSASRSLSGLYEVLKV